MSGIVLGACLLLQTVAAPSGDAGLAAAREAARLGRTAAAVLQLRAVIRKGPPEIAGQARLELVRIFGRKGDWLSAAEQLEELRRLAPADPEYAYQLGVAYLNISRSAFLRIKFSAPESARFKQLEGEQLAAIGNVPGAIRRYQDAIAADASLPGSHLGLAVLYFRAGRKADALAEIDKELAIAPDSAVARQVKMSIEGEK